MSICRAAVALTLALEACGGSPEPCMRNSDCASNEYCSAGACLIMQSPSEGGVTMAGMGGAAGAGGSLGVGGSAGSATVMMPDVSVTDVMTPDASRTVSDAASESDANVDGSPE